MASTSASSLERLTNVLADMVEQESQMVVDLLGSFRDSLRSVSTTQLTRTLRQMVPAQLTTLQSCGCHIPPPCWLPQSAGEVTSFVCAGATATVQIQVTNCGAATRSISFQATGQDAGRVTFSPSSLTLAPFERGIASASISQASGAAEASAEVILWARGCRLHYVRWAVRTTSRGGTCCHQVDIDDCPDLVHHWYDHFYCERPCLPDQPSHTHA